MPKIGFRNRGSKDLKEWSNRDFVIYFSDLLEKNYGDRFDIPPVAWQGLMARMKGFRVKTKLTEPEQYKEFVDNVFALFFTKPGYIPAFGSICSNKVLGVIERLKKKKPKVNVPSYTNEDFEELQHILYRDESLFDYAKKNINLYE